MAERPNATLLLPDAKGKAKPYKLRFDLNALVLLESSLGKSLQTLLNRPPEDVRTDAEFLADLFTAANIQAFLYAGLQRFHPEMDRELLGRMVGLAEYPAVIAAIAEGLTDALGGLTPIAGDPPGKKPASGAAGRRSKTSR